MNALEIAVIAVVIILLMLILLIATASPYTKEHVHKTSCTNGVCTTEDYWVCNGVKCADGQTCSKSDGNCTD